MAEQFSGFSSKAFTFLRQLQKNNTREWFNPRKEIFEKEVRAPMLQLAELINRDLAAFAADHVTDPKKAVYRIYRDTRFSNDKTPYKTHIAAIFPRRGLGKHAGASYYVQVSHESVEIAGGIYMPGPEELAAVRSAIADDPATFRKIVEAKSVKAAAGELIGDQLSRVPAKFPPDHPAADYLRMKQWYFDVTLSPKEALLGSLRKRIITVFKAMSPVLGYLNNILLQARGGEEDEVDGIPKRPEPMF